MNYIEHKAIVFVTGVIPTLLLGNIFVTLLLIFQLGVIFVCYENEIRELRNEESLSNS